MKALIPTITILLFLGGCHYSLVPAWRIAEKFHIQDIHTDVPEYFPILSHGTNDNSAFGISRWKDRETAKFVTNIDNHQLDEINRQLLSTITDTPEQYDKKYFKIIARGDSFVDVSLEVPTLHESHTEGWYRIQDNKITPQRFLTYGPGFAFIAILYSWLLGFCYAALFLIGVKIYKKRKNRTSG